MKTVAIITEYNPFHYGHLYQIEQLRANLGQDTRFIAIMSGNFTQRGEIAIADKTVRARAAVDAGVDLVLELPFPYSSSSAEFFANCGVSIADSLGVVDYLAFGSECGSIDDLISYAQVIESEEYKTRLFELQKANEHKDIGYPALCELAFNKVSGTTRCEFTPNNILAIEYIKALKKLKSKIVPVTIKREGSNYTDTSISEGLVQSASAIRVALASSEEAINFIPDSARKAFIEAKEKGMFPTLPQSLDSAIISHLRLNPPSAKISIHDAGGGLYNRLHALSFEVTSISALVQAAETKKYTKARIRRAILNSYFGVTSSAIRSLPSYTQVLGMSNLGRELLKEIKKKSDFPVITKPSSYEKYGECVVKQKELSDRADSIFALTHKKAVSGKISLKLTPYVKLG